jgi:hypothetical protein
VHTLKLLMIGFDPARNAVEGHRRKANGKEIRRYAEA